MDKEKYINPEEQIIKDEIYKAMDQKNGLTLLPFLTGTGKSYSVKEYIADELCTIWKNQQEEKEYTPKRIIYIAPNKNNLITPKELKMAMKKKLPTVKDNLMAIEDDVIEAFIELFIKDQVGFMKNNLDSLIDGLKSLGRNWDERGTTFRKWFRELEELTKREADYEDFNRWYKAISQYAMKKEDTLKVESGTISAMDNELVELLKGNAEDAERELRKKIGKLWRSARPRDKDNNKTLMQKNEIRGKLLAIVTQLFPDYNFEDKTVLIMTVNKFIAPIDPILKKSIFLYDKLKNRETTIVMDEIDSAYATIIDHYLDEGVKHGYELSRLLSEIILHYSSRGLSKDRIEEAEKEAFPDETNVCRLKNIHEEGMKLLDKYHLDKNYVAIDNEDAEKYLKAILNDGTLTTLCDKTDGKKKEHYILCQYNRKKQKVIMSISDDDKQAEKTNCFNLEDMIKDGLKLIRRMGIYLNQVTYAYMQLSTTKWKKANSKSVALDSADVLEIIMTAMMMSEGDQKYFKSYCLALRTYRTFNMNRQEKEKYIEPDYSYFSRGINLLSLENSNEWQNEKTDIRVYAASNTPEGLLVHMAQNSNVVGLSATGFNASVSDNFYLPYIKEQLKENFREISPECIDQLRAFSKVKWRDYLGNEPKARIECMKLPSNETGTFPEDSLPPVIPQGNSSEGILKTKFCKAGAEKEYKRLRDFLKDTMEIFGKQNNYIWNRYWGLFLALYDFYSNQSLHAMLVLETKIPKDGDITSSNIDYSSKIIERAIRIICGSLKIDFDSTSLYIAKASNFDKIRKEVIERWENDEKAILFSAYATTSKGTNLPIPITDRNCGQAQVTILPEYYDPNNHKYQSMDIDCLYLGRLTHLVKEIPVNGERNIRTKALLTCLTEGTKLYAMGQISYYEKACYCYNLLKAYQNYHCIKAKKIRATPGIRNSINKVLAQSLGRIDRTYKKSPLTKIYIEESNLAQIDYGELKQQRLTNPLLDMLTMEAGIVQSDTYKQVQLKENEKCDANRVQSSHPNSLGHFKRLFTSCHDSRPKVRKMAIQYYQGIRDFTLHHPTATDDEIFENSFAKHYYTPFSSEREGYVIQMLKSKVEGSEDTDDWTIKYIPPGDTSKGGNPTRDIDEQHTILGVIRKNQWLSRKFEEEGIPLTWPKGKWLLTPKGFDLYKGILAEKAFEIIMNNMIAKQCKSEGIDSILLREMDEEVFEVCDFYFFGCYIDVKSWRYGTKQSEEKFKKICAKKRALCNEHYHDNGKIVIVNFYPNDASIDNRNMFQDRHYLEIRRLLQPDGSFDKKAIYCIHQLIINGIEIYKKRGQNHDGRNDNNSQNQSIYLSPEQGEHPTRLSY